MHRGSDRGGRYVKLSRAKRVPCIGGTTSHGRSWQAPLARRRAFFCLTCPRPAMRRPVTDRIETSPLISLAGLGWSDFFADQIAADEKQFIPARIATVHRARLTAICAEGSVELTLAHLARTGDFTVGDWVLADPRIAAAPPPARRAGRCWSGASRAARRRSSPAPMSTRCSSSPPAMPISIRRGWSAIWRWPTRPAPSR